MADNLTIAELIKRSHGTAKEKGWWDPTKSKTFIEQLMLMVSELSEALEDFRIGKQVTEEWTEENGKPCGIPSELADVMIRIADTCGRYGVDLEGALNRKMEYNDKRSYRHGNKLA